MHARNIIITEVMMADYFEEKHEKGGIIGRGGVIRRVDNMIALGDMEKAWHETGKLKFVARHKRFGYDPRVYYITEGRMPISVIRDVLYASAGASSPEEYQKSIDEVYGKPVAGETLMFLHFGDFK